MTQKTKGKIARGLAGILIGCGLVGSGSGCETTDSSGLGFLGSVIGAGAYSPRATPNESLLLGGIGQGLSNMAQNEALENSGAKINVNVNQIPPQNYPKFEVTDYLEKKIEVVTCGDFEKEEEDSARLERIKDRKSVFNSNEDLWLIAYLRGYQGKDCEIKIISPSGNLFHDVTTPVEWNDNIRALNCPTNKLEIGTYIARVYLNGKEAINPIIFEIKP